MKNIYCSLLNINDLNQAAANGALGEWLKDNASGQYTYKTDKKGLTKITGKIILKVPGDDFGPLVISNVNGSLHITGCNNIKSLEGLFAEGCTIKGDFSVNKCPALVSLKGAPYDVLGTLTIADCPRLKVLDAGTHCSDVIVMKLGKKFSKDQVQSAFPAAYSIMCGEEGIEANIEEGQINEALFEPHLLRLAQDLKQSKADSKKLTLKDVIKGAPALDQVDASDATTYVLSDPKQKAACSKAVLAMKYDNTFIVLAYNDDDHASSVVHLSGRSYDIWNFDYKDGYIKYVQFTTGTLMRTRDVLMNNGYKKIVTIDMTGKTSVDARRYRFNNKPDNRTDDDIRADNMKRYAANKLQLQVPNLKKKYYAIGDEIVKVMDELKAKVIKYRDYENSNMRVVFNLNDAGSALHGAIRSWSDLKDSARQLGDPDDYLGTDNRAAACDRDYKRALESIEEARKYLSRS